MKKEYALYALAGLGCIAMYNNYYNTKKTDEAKTVKDQIDKTPSAPVTGQTAGMQATHTADTLLSKGSKGDMVKALQLQINLYLPSGYTKLVPDGVFGTKTETALQTFWGVKAISYNDLKSKPITPQMAAYTTSKGKSTTVWGTVKNTFKLPGF